MKNIKINRQGSIIEELLLPSLILPYFLYNLQITNLTYNKLNTMNLYIQKDETNLKRFIPIGITYTKYTNILKQPKGCLTVFSWWGKYGIHLDIYFKLKNKYGN